MANSVNFAASDLGLYCLLRPVVFVNYGNLIKSNQLRYHPGSAPGFLCYIVLCSCVGFVCGVYLTIDYCLFLNSPSFATLGRDVRRYCDIS